MVSGLGGATRCRCFLVDLSGVLPIRRATVIVERGLTAHLEFDGAADAERPDQRAVRFDREADRGYDQMEAKLRGIGADIERITSQLDALPAK